MIRWGGTAYRLHPLFVLLMLASVLTGYFAEMMTLFGVVTIHELGHVAAAKSFGWRVRQVQLLPFGGVAEVDESANVPAREEFVVALCGPLQNAWMAAFAWGMKLAGWGDPAYWDYFLQANVMIGLFNLLPALPLDGGKLLQSLLSYMMPYHRTLSFMTVLSILIALMLGTASLLRYPSGGIQLNLLVIAVFLFYTNWYGHKNLHFQFLRFLVNREKRAGALLEAGRMPLPLLVRPDTPPMEVFRRFMRESPHLLYIVGQGGRVLRVLPEAHLLQAYLNRLGPPVDRRAGPDSFRPPRPPKIG
ncbi:M50 family metallopeptidase [Gorillibacterium sp. sgz5001074]|uniref:M50 family metallopeptidase n=1 Tax=Gorillibacterium sp. sgz5001074 TaxID=3446695 RepID=UPI003F678532